ncbi:aldo/keto reductase [Streptomyces albipurpureus]|uniref:Aldo/keto reductase n=1 Tax=Streptomyces albipurpureus TaxID=2897419 RepID=A0ABT0UF96_9ACTN|nr:aldo/keto reductase [Streptomyces sp. CWNU-1]MCM2387044.1 aldo/keto reductase [Streptomyces sp. CWNU-1]
MKQRNLGRTGLRVSELCLGTMSFADDASGHPVLDAFAEAGGTFVDTADMYDRGGSEEILGRWLQGRRRDDLVIATKVWATMGDAPNDGGLSRKHIVSAVEASLRRLRTDYIDLYQAHIWDATTPIDETLSALDALVRSGKVRYLGTSNVTASQLQRSLDLARRHGWEPYVCLQPLYNLLRRETEWELLPLCAELGVGVIPYRPLGGGWLTGKYQRDMESAPAGSREAYFQEQSGTKGWRGQDTEETWRVIDAVREVAAETGHSMTQVALRWLLERPGVTAPIIGPRTVEQTVDNLGAVGWELTDEQSTRLTEASARPLPYPYDLLAQLGD